LQERSVKKFLLGVNSFTLVLCTVVFCLSGYAFGEGVAAFSAKDFLRTAALVRAPRAPAPATPLLTLYPLPWIANVITKVHSPTVETNVLISTDQAHVNNMDATGLVNFANAQLVLPVVAGAPVTGTAGQVVVIGGMPYIFDETRNTWISIDREMVWAARSGSVTNSYLRIFDGISSQATGYQVMRDSVITGLSVASSGNTWFIASSGGDFTSLSAALASPSVVNGDTLLLNSETFTIASQVNVNKSVTIRGCGPAAVVQTAGTAIDPVRVLYVTVGNVAIKNVTIKQRKTSNTSIESAIEVNAPGATGIAISGRVVVETMEFGIIMHAAEWSIENSTLEYQGPPNNNHRFIAVFGNNGNCRIVNTLFSPSNDPVPGRTVFCLLTASGGDTYNGSLLIDNNRQIGAGNLRQFITQEAFSGAPGALQLYVSNNTYTDLNGGITLFSGAGMLNLFSSISIINNHAFNGAGRGVVTLDGVGVGVNPGSTTWYMSGNTLVNPGVTAVGFADAMAAPGLMGYRTTVFAPLLIPFSTLVLPQPVTPSRYSLQVRRNGCSDVLTELPVYFDSAISTTQNVSVQAGDWLQFYLAGTIINPTAGIEFANQAPALVMI